MWNLFWYDLNHCNSFLSSFFPISNHIHVAHNSGFVSVGPMGAIAPTDWNPRDMEHISSISSVAINDKLALTFSNVPRVPCIESFKYFIWDCKSLIWNRNKKRTVTKHFQIESISLTKPILSYYEGEKFKMSPNLSAPHL